MKYWISTIAFLFVLGCIGDKHKPITCQAADTATFFPDKLFMVLDLQTISVKEYISYIQNSKMDRHSTNMIVVTPADTGWVKKNDIPFLIELLPSKKPAPCVMNVVSSQLPFEHSTLGGHAARIINSYKLHTPFPEQLTECPETDSSEIALIQKWWKNQDH